MDYALTSSRLLERHGLDRLRDACWDLLMEDGCGRMTSIAYLHTHRQTGLDVVHALHVYATQYAFLDEASRFAQLEAQTAKFGNGEILQARPRAEANTRSRGPARSAPHIRALLSCRLRQGPNTRHARAPRVQAIELEVCHRGAGGNPTGINFWVYPLRSCAAPVTLLLRCTTPCNGNSHPGTKTWWGSATDTQPICNRHEPEMKPTPKESNVTSHIEHEHETDVR